MKKPFISFWLKLKPQINFEYATLPYDTDKKSLKLVLAKKKEIEQITLEKSEAMWRNLFDDDFGLTRFYFENVEITARVWSHSKTCRIDLLTKKYQKDCQKIEDFYFSPKFLSNGNWKSEYAVGEVIGNQQTIANKSSFNFKVINKNFDVDLVVDVLGKGLDPKIKNLVKVLNQLGIITTASCQGHTDHGLSYPWVDISMLDLPNFLAMLDKLQIKEYKDFWLESFKYEFRFKPPFAYSLRQGQIAFQKLSKLPGPI